MTELNDQTLLTYWYRNRNAEAFHILAARHARMVYATALRVLRDVQAAEDVSQESFLALAQAKRPPSRNVAAWLHRTAYHAALDVIRSRKRRDARDLEYSRAQPDAAHIAWDDIRELVDEAVVALPESSREPLVRYFFEQESHAAIATALGMPRQTVSHRIGKGIEQVRKQLKDKGIVAPAGVALATLIMENSADALPASIMQEVGRTALVATPSMWAVVATYTSGAAFKVAAAMLVVGVSAAVFVGTQSKDSPAPTAPVAMAEAVSAPGAPVAPAEEPLPVAALEPVPEGGSDPAAAMEPVATLVSASNRASLSGVVLLPDGTPYAHATVWLMAGGYEPQDRPKGMYFSLPADASGRFTQTEMLPAEYMVLVTEPNSDGYAWDSELAKVTLAPGEHKSGLELHFGTEGDLSISGTVVSSTGNPLKGILVATVGSVRRTAVSDEEGQFMLSYLPDEQFTVHVPRLERNQAVTKVRAGDQNVQLVVALDGEIQGRAVDAKTRKPIVRIETTYMQGRLLEFEQSRAFGWRSSYEPEGMFQLAPVPAGDLTVAVRAVGYEITLAPVTVEEGKTVGNLEVAMEPAHAITLAGNVVTEEGQPVEGARIYTGRIPVYDSEGDARSDAQGRFEIPNALPGIEKLYAAHPDFASASAAVSEDTTIVMAQAGRVVVEVYSDGAPMPKAGTGVRSEGGEYDEAVRTDDAGRATFDKVPGGELLIEVRPDDARLKSTNTVLAPGEEKIVRVDIAPAETSVEGMVYRDGEPVSSAMVRLFVETAAGSETLSQSVTASGEFRFAQVPLGKAQLGVVTGNPHRSAFVDDVALTAGQVTTVDLDVTEAAQLQGMVNGVAANEVAQIVVYRGTIALEEALNIGIGRPVDPAVASKLRIDESGAFESPLQKPGTYTVVLYTCPDNDATQRIHRDYRVVEVPESGALNLDFNLSL